MCSVGATSGDAAVTSCDVEMTSGTKGPFWGTIVALHKL